MSRQDGPRSQAASQGAQGCHEPLDSIPFLCPSPVGATELQSRPFRRLLLARPGSGGQPWGSSLLWPGFKHTGASRSLAGPQPRCAGNGRGSSVATRLLPGFARVWRSPPTTGAALAWEGLGSTNLPGGTTGPVLPVSLGSRLRPFMAPEERELPCRGPSLVPRPCPALGRARPRRAVERIDTVQAGVWCRGWRHLGS